jgi:SAM-dependent methyltransferase
MPLDMVKDGHLGGYVRGGDPGTWCPTLWNWIIQKQEIRSVLDVGCGEGHSTYYFQQLGCEVLGVDGCRRAIAESVLPGAVAQHDFCDGPLETERTFDMAWSCEFLEHVEARFLPNILRTFDLAKRFLLVTHAFPGHDDGHHHVNCRPSGYWIRHIESLGFTCDVALTLAARRVTLADYPGINHFARSGLVFVRQPAAAGTSRWTGIGNIWKSMRINTGFRLSSAFRQQRRRRKAQKRHLGVPHI